MTVSGKAVGNMLASMGFNHTQRTKEEYILWLDSETRQRCHQLMKTHGTPYLEDTALKLNSKDCPECKELATAAGS
jgi:hypothetical protein